MITEDYVSLEIAKLLQNKGFDGEFHKHYWGYEPGKEFLTSNSFNSEYDYPAPTLQTVIKWLREVHNIFFNVNYFHIDIGNKWAYLTIWLPYKNGCEFSVEGFDIETVYETAIRYCLENLI